MTILEIQFPEDFNERYQEYHGVLLDILRNKEPKVIMQENKVLDKGIDILQAPKKPAGRSNTNPKVIVDLQKGIYNEKSPTLIYEISGKRKNLMEYLCNIKFASLADLVAVTGQGDTLIVKELREINDHFKKCCKLKKDLITHSKTGGGYTLNRSDLDIKTFRTST